MLDGFGVGFRGPRRFDKTWILKGSLRHWRKTHSSNLYSPTPWRERAAKRRSSLQIASDPCARLAQSPNILTGRIPWRERAAKRRSSLQTASVTCARLAPPANIFVYSSPVRKTIADTRKVQPLMNKNALPVQLLSQVPLGGFLGPKTPPRRPQEAPKTALKI